MIRALIGMTAIALLASGCCGPMGCGPGCGAGPCYDCDGVAPPMAMGPLDHLRNCRKQLVCGSGCGEVYRGEWMSTPPDCNDPCCGGQFVGGAVTARPFCHQPGSLLAGLCGNLYGGRVCKDCGVGCSSCGCGGQVGGGYVEPAPCGCASCSSQNGATTRMAQARQATDAESKPPAPGPRRTSPR